MQLNITGDFITQVIEASPDSSDLPAQIAGQLLSSIDQTAMAAYLLTREAAVSLLVERLKSDPMATVQALQGLPAREAETPKPPRRGRKTAAASATPRPRKTRTKTRTKAKAKAKAKKDKRQRLTAEQVADLKGQVRAFLKANGWSSRRELSAAVKLDTQSIYRRIMGELQKEGVVASKGEKALAVYGLK